MSGAKTAQESNHCCTVDITGARQLFQNRIMAHRAQDISLFLSIQLQKDTSATDLRLKK